MIDNPTKDLSAAEEEAQIIRALLETAQPLIDAAASVEAVLQGIEQLRWLHLACHGQAETTPPDCPHSVFSGRLYLASAGTGESSLYT